MALGKQANTKILHSSQRSKEEGTQEAALHSVSQSISPGLSGPSDTIYPDRQSWSSLPAQTPTAGLELGLVCISFYFPCDLQL